MESNYQKLIQSLSEASKILESGISGDESSEANSAETPHLELIDFDRLQKMLQAAISHLESARIRDQELTVARRWFSDRIASLRRGRKAILQHQQSGNNTNSPDESTLPDLIRYFEEEAALMRSTASNNQLWYNGRGGQKADDFRPFKS
jgi:hypothetical protein